MNPTCPQCQSADEVEYSKTRVRWICKRAECMTREGDTVEYSSFNQFGVIGRNGPAVDSRVRLLIGCTPRSGSTWLANSLQASGLMVGHERDWINGCCGYMTHKGMGSQSTHLDSPEGKKIHLIRNPAEAIASLSARNMPAGSMLDFLPKRPNWTSAQYWETWNRQAAAWADYTVSLESLVAGDVAAWGVLGVDPCWRIPVRRNANDLMERNRALYAELTGI